MYAAPMPKMNARNHTSLSMAVVRKIGAVSNKKILKVLFDPDSTRTLIHRGLVPKEAIPTALNKTKTVDTIAGTMVSGEKVILRDIRLPEFENNRVINEQNALLFDKKIRYDIIFGSNFMAKTGIDVMYSTKTVNWYVCFGAA